ncbi:MAG: D-alanine--D-alanine ligase [Bacteroidales bacterium]|nr:D-alanine--D-alanine ligase [Bacteroidales bacterium]
MKKTVAIVYGGYSSEAVVSEKSLAGLLTFIDSEKYNLVPVFISRTEWSAVINGKHLPINREDFSFDNEGKKVKIDFAYITIHGAPGENGQLAGYLEMLGVPHSTCPSLTSAMTYDKFVCNSYLRSFDVCVADSVLVKKGRPFDVEKIAARLGMPCFVKPSAAGSSFGVSKVKSIEQMMPAIEKAFTESDDVVIESFLDGTEVTCGLYKTKQRTVIFPLTEVVSSNEFFDYEAKYTPGKTQEITPARVPDDIRDKVQQTASQVYDLMNMRGIARIDFIICKDKIALLEVNTTPGMTATSFIPQQIKASGAKLNDVFTEVIEDILN